ncbi:MAG: hypothetical protein HC803_05120 [Saprospiraceae bacterium]|nr:hypothetical protein [Saprospiraceae bacterium]
MTNHINITIPRVYQSFKDVWKREQPNFIRLYLDNKVSFIPNLLPEDAIRISTFETISILNQKLGNVFDLATNEENTRLDNHNLPEIIRSPVRHKTDGKWLKQSNMVGINVRTIGSFWNIIKYAFTLPKSQDSIHLLPIWEPGVVASLYGMASWNINNEFYSRELTEAIPHLNTVEKQLKAVINILHAMGKTVGMDVIPHTDRFSEIVLSNPQYFEWLQRENYEIVNHRADLHEEVQEMIILFLKQYGPSNPFDAYPKEKEIFFSENFSEEKRNIILFGKPEQVAIRQRRRDALLRYLTKYGYEPVPATMAPPYRGLRVDYKKSEQDTEGQLWREYAITQPESFSRVFGPLTRYKLYERLEDNKQWKIDFSRPRPAIWNYVAQHYQMVQEQFSFDFMRGDMSHVQMRENGVPSQFGQFYDILAEVKNFIRDAGVEYFGYFAETFLAPRNVMSYGDEIDHLEASECDSTLGDLQSVTVNTPVFLQRFRQYLDILETRKFAPNFTIITADKDDPRFDEFYISGNEFRLFTALFLTNMPSYMSLGFRTRDTHHSPAPNEHYTKLYVFQISEGEKATTGDYVWGRNGSLYNRLLQIQLYADKIWETIQRKSVQWLIYPDAAGFGKVIVWTQAENPTHIFVANTDSENAIVNFAIPKIKNIENTRLKFDFSTSSTITEIDKYPFYNGKHYNIFRLEKGECRVYLVD